MKRFILLFFIIFVGVQAQADDPPLSPAVAYWKALTIEEKEMFLFSYLVQVYETDTQLKTEVGYGGVSKWYYDNRAELAYGIFDKLESIDLKQFVKWIDEYYSHGEFANKPFYEALEFAYRFQQASGETLWEKYENLKYGKIKPGNQ
ncbi:MAG: hypothetical protein HOK52_01615 [Candidatus Marinimicrobia bacterium]|jgi:hypothetical protein|nr:hypothetical protein [Candidatus Neomarinimicrobiota bacterium]MBT3937142.1 hypothetical protein [Candidatus Neomarinimicrobiota bacterium]MBT3962112.1 hypothetical protein [Candidatus Neomarinimicrobiota bacterium]MBT4382480.1 hypothetical protein [Candidatus Neomarinimicrobiota bacterium]MBT4636597.1 hypothetical protein [Candidatus Neomarinimicrobiota bacterium]|tara:strand:+ start:340 stop:780 length:441 start_codon:yes stop_codon:yes gene_type:complete